MRLEMLEAGPGVEVIEDHLRLWRELAVLRRGCDDPYAVLRFDVGRLPAYVDSGVETVCRRIENDGAIGALPPLFGVANRRAHVVTLSRCSEMVRTGKQGGAKEEHEGRGGRAAMPALK